MASPKVFWIADIGKNSYSKAPENCCQLGRIKQPWARSTDSLIGNDNSGFTYIAHFHFMCAFSSVGDTVERMWIQAHAPLASWPSLVCLCLCQLLGCLCRARSWNSEAVIFATQAAIRTVLRNCGDRSQLSACKVLGKGGRGLRQRALKRKGL